MCLSDSFLGDLTGVLTPFIAGQFSSPEQGATKATAPATRASKAAGGVTPPTGPSLTPPTAADTQKTGASLLLGS